MTIVASNSITVSNVSDGTITHTAYSKSADGTDGFTTTYPNLNLLEDGKFAKPISSKWNTDGTTILKDNTTGYFKVIFNGTGSFNRAYYTAGISTIPIGQKYSVYIKAYSLEDSLNIKLGSVNTSQAVTVTKNGNVPKIYKVDGLVRGTSDTLGIFGGLTTTLGTLFISEIKVEQGSMATTWMPSSSEVTTADWPSYIGQYTDFTQADSTNPSDYTWSLMRGNDGKDGADGKDGLAGKDGVGIKSTTIAYQASTNGTTTPTGTWSASVPTVAKGSFLWTRTIWTYTDNTTETGYAVAYMGTNGNNGTDGIAGKDGVGIQTTTITYAGSTSGTTAPSSGWTSTVPTVAAGSYLWTKTVWTYTDNSSETGYSVAMMGVKGDKGDPGIKGSDGTSGIIVSSVAPASPQTGQLWQDTSTTPQLVKKWTGASWVIWELYAQNLKADKLDVISGNLGTMIAGIIKVMADIIINAAGNTKKFGMLLTKKGLLSTGPTFNTAGQASDTKMAVASLTQGELRFINMDYNENLEQVQDSGTSSANNGFIRFSSTAEKGDLLEISSGGSILLDGFTTQTNDWTKLTDFAYYKVMFGRVNIRVGLTSGSSIDNIYLGVVPDQYKSPNGDMMLPAQAWSINTGLDRHVQYSVNGSLYLLNPEPNTKYVFEVSYTL